MLGPKRFVTDVAYPLAQRVGELWSAGKLEVRHEHLLSDVLATQLRVQLSAFEDMQDGPTLLLTTLPDEPHGLALTMIALYSAVHHIVPRLLGVNTPPEQVVSAASALGVAAVGISVVVPPDPAKTARHLRAIAAEVPRGVRVWVGGMGAPSLGLKTDAIAIVQTWADLDAVIADLR